MKILAGELKEEIFIHQLEDGGAVKDLDPSNVIIKKTSIIKKDELAYIHGKKLNLDYVDLYFLIDRIGYHRVSNPSADTLAISLHLYTPAFTSCRIFIPGSQVYMGKCGFDTRFGIPLTLTK